MTLRPETMAAPACRFCESPYTAYVRDVPLRRISGSAPLYYCMTCGSFWHPQIYTEPEDQLQKDALWHITVEERNTRMGNNFLNAITKGDPEFPFLPEVKSFIEIGCGTATLMDVARKRGMKVIGYDTNPYAPVIAKERHGIDIETTLWTADTLSERYDLVVCISTVEHLPNPQLLIREMATYCKRHRAAAYVSVPFAVERDAWHYLLDPVPKDLSNPFYLSDVHINQFSRLGFETMCKMAGATHVTYFPRGWIGYWLRFD